MNEVGPVRGGWVEVGSNTSFHKFPQQITTSFVSVSDFDVPCVHVTDWSATQWGVIWSTLGQSFSNCILQTYVQCVHFDTKFQGRAFGPHTGESFIRWHHVQQSCILILILRSFPNISFQRRPHGTNVIRGYHVCHSWLLII